MDGIHIHIRRIVLTNANIIESSHIERVLFICLFISCGQGVMSEKRSCTLNKLLVVKIPTMNSNRIFISQFGMMLFYFAHSPDSFSLLERQCTSTYTFIAQNERNTENT